MYFIRESWEEMFLRNVCLFRQDFAVLLPLERAKTNEVRKMEMDFQQYKLIVESSPNMIWRAGTDAKCDYFNQTWLRFTGRTIAQETGDGWTEGVHADDFSRCLQVYLDSFAKREPFEMEYRLRRFDGQYRWINDRGVPLYDNVDTFIGYIGSCMDVTDKIEGQLLKEQAQKDGLCQIYNRYYFEKLLISEIENARQQDSYLAVIMLDIDDFKHVNDRYGHPIGDIVLRQVASTIKESIRDIDVCGRYGGEEFIVFIVHTSLNKALEVADRIRQAIAEKIIPIDLVNIHSISVTVSCGVSYLLRTDSKEELIQRADKGLYMAKHSGKNCVKTVEFSTVE